MLFLQAARLAFSFAEERAGSSNEARIAMIAITTSNSINVNAFSFFICMAAMEMVFGIGRGKDMFFSSIAANKIRLPLSRMFKLGLERCGRKPRINTNEKACKPTCAFGLSHSVRRLFAVGNYSRSDWSAEFIPLWRKNNSQDRTPNGAVH